MAELPGLRTIIWRPGHDESPGRSAGRRARWLAAALRNAYDLPWVPESIVANIECIDVDAERRMVVLTLQSGTSLVDQFDRISVVGTADDVAIHELVEAVRRRGWSRVDVHGTDAFKQAVTNSLARLEPPVRVANYVAANHVSRRELPLMAPALQDEQAGPGL